MLRTKRKKTQVSRHSDDHSSFKGMPMPMGVGSQGIMSGPGMMPSPGMPAGMSSNVPDMRSMIYQQIAQLEKQKQDIIKRLDETIERMKKNLSEIEAKMSGKDLSLAGRMPHKISDKKADSQ